MKSIESSAKTMEEAVTLGLEKLGVSLGDVTIDIIDEGSKGLFGLIGGKPTRVRLTVRDGVEDTNFLSSLSLNNDEPAPAREKQQPKAKQDVKPDKAPQPKPEKQQKQDKPTPAEKTSRQDKPVAADKQPKPQTAYKQEKPTPESAEKPAREAVVLQGEDTPEGKAQRFLMEVTRLMNVDVSVDASADNEGNVKADMHGDTLGILIGRRGETLDALQYLTSLYVNRGQDDYTRVTIDTENYRAKREEALTRLANRMANRAIKTGRKVVLEPMNPYERRILHSALQQNEAVTTHSEGDEPNRHVVITLK
jgi:spoIIIJ-associated protein